MIIEIVKILWRAFTERFKKQLAVMLYNAAEMYDGFLGLISLGFYDGDIIRVNARRAIIDWLGVEVLTKV